MRKADRITRLSSFFINFNGAALFQVRKAVLEIDCCGASRGTSMGPHSFKCGKRYKGGAQVRPHRRTSMGPHSFKCGKPSRQNLRRRRRIYFNGAALFQVRKGLKASHVEETNKELQWGRTLSSAESVFESRNQRGPASALQWGRTLSSAESFAS